jgi:2,5-furandicarboxylate decarboxylase 1
MGLEHLKDIGAIIDDLDAMGRLVRIKSEVDINLDLAGIAAEFERGPRAVLFENVKGQDAPVLIGLYWSRELLGALMRAPERRTSCPGLETHPEMADRSRRPGRAGRWSCARGDRKGRRRHQAAGPGSRDQGWRRLFRRRDGHHQDPDTGVRNASIQRFQIIDEDTLAVNIDSGRHLELYLAKARAKEEHLAFTLNVGIGPGFHFASSAPAEAAPPEKDELGIASEFHGEPVELVASDLSDSEMVAHAMYGLECELLSDEEHMEGPFAEVTGCYAAHALRGKVKVKRIHRRKNPIMQTILPGTEVHNSVGLLGEANVLNLLKLQVPGVKDVFFTHGGCGFYGAVVQITQTRAGWAKQAILAAFAAFPPLKSVTVVDDDVNIYDPTDVEWAMTTRMDADKGIMIFRDIFGHGLNPSFPNYLGNKVGYDATQPFPHRPEFERAAMKKMSLDGLEIVTPDIVASRD